MATSSFFYGSTPGPDQSTVDQLIADLQAKVQSAQEASNAAAASAAAAQSAAEGAKASEDSTSALLIQAQLALQAALAAQAAAEDALALAQSAIDSVADDAAAADAARIAAQAARDAALVAETNAELAETNAETAQAAAQASATAAATSATNASTSASSASSSASTATTQATNAASSATSAAASATTATTKASEASSSATSASTSASNAATSATTATTKASEASASATAAASSATAAGTSASNASSSASAAATSATNAANSATAAGTSATNASNSATAAATSATNASNSASAAATSASDALSSANAASSSATAASGSATAAAGSASTATTQATNAASSATAAAASASAAASALDSFDDRYLGSKTSAPTLDNDGNALVTGALYYNDGTVTSDDKGMWVYDGSQWIKASSASQAALTVYRYTATAGQTTFSGADSNSLTLSYLPGGLVVSLNGAVLVGSGVDYTASNGTSVVLASGAIAGDILEVYAFSSFTIANVYTKAEVDAAFVDLDATQTITNKTISADNNTLSGIAASSFVLSDASGNIDGSAAQKAIPSGAVVGTTDTQTLSNKTITNLIMDGYIREEVFAVSGTTPALSPSNGTIQTWTLSGNSTPTQGTWNNGESITLMILDGTAFTITWTSLGVVWVGGTAPTLDTTKYTVIELWEVGNIIYGASVGAA